MLWGGSGRVGLIFPPNWVGSVGACGFAVLCVRMYFDDFSVINKSMEGFWIGFGVVSRCVDGGLLMKFKLQHGKIES